MHDSRTEVHTVDIETCKSGHTSADEDSTYDFELVSDACSCIGLYINEHMVNLSATPEDRSTFDASCEPLIGIIPYFQRICRYSKLTPESACSALILVKRVCSNPENCLSLTNYNAHRLLLTSSMVFAKFYDDEIDSNARWAKIAGLQLSELNILEVDLLNFCNFDLRVSREAFDSCIKRLLEMRDMTPTMQPPVNNSLARSTSARSGRSPPSAYRSPNHRSRQRHTLNGFSPPPSRAGSPTSGRTSPQSREGTPDGSISGSPSGVSSPKHRRTVSGAFISFFHGQHKLHHHHHHNNMRVSSQDSELGEAASTPTSPTQSPHHGFHLRIPRTTSLQSISQMLHVSPRFNKSKHKKERGVSVRRESTKDEESSDGMLAFVAQPQDRDRFVPQSQGDPGVVNSSEVRVADCIPANHENREVVSNVLAH